MNVKNMSDKQCRDMIKTVPLYGLEICDGDDHRLLTDTDIEKFPPSDSHF